jgi:hypothetical protein
VAKRKRRLPDDWAPNDTHRRIAGEIGVDSDREAIQFGDHHRAKGTVMLDWDAAFRTWLRNAKKFGHPQPNGASEPRPDYTAGVFRIERR